MAANGNSTSTMGEVLRDVRLALGDVFGGGKLDPKQELIVDVLFGLLGALARADGVVSSEEANFTNGLMDELKLSSRARKLATEAFDRGCRRQLDIDTEILRFLRTCPRGSKDVDRVYESLLRLAAADACIRPGERRFLEKITLGMGYEPAELDTRLKRIMQ
ncbi:MAG: TerB family tellurite resistance protein [Rudaea sp.]|nr:TerB family tellurite resistance protein [Rudaea sp.]